uniref:Uncharacterized protein n=1 Tax=Romanomermis culicivorax TaxID=13658 RepID=A0A915IN34_ROMCU
MFRTSKMMHESSANFQKSYTVETRSTGKPKPRFEKLLFEYNARSFVVEFFTPRRKLIDGMRRGFFLFNIILQIRSGRVVTIFRKNLDKMHHESMNMLQK